MLEFVQTSQVNAPTLPPLPQRAVADHLVHTLRGEGLTREWDICSGSSGVCLMTGVRGHDEPSANWFTTESPAANGAREHGYRINPREIYHPLEIWREGTEDWLQLYRQFLHDTNFRRRVWWTIRNPVNGAERRLLFRYRADGARAFEQAPEYVGWADYSRYGDAREQPMWQGETIVIPWGVGSARTFLQDGVINITSQEDVENATAFNPGDEDAPFMLRLGGAWDENFAVTVAGRTVRLAKPLDGTVELTIDTSPTRPGIFLPNGTNVTRQWAAEFDMLTVPAGQRVPIVMRGSGGTAGWARLEMTPLYDDGFPVAYGELDKALPGTIDQARE